MATEDVCALVFAFCCCTFMPFVLQSVGFFTPMWGSNSTCDSIGLLYSCCAGTDNMTCENTNGGNELDARALGLETTSFSVMFLAVLFSCCGGCCKGDDDDPGWCAILGGCCIMLFPVASLFSVIGCIIVATKFSTFELGYSFALCLTAGVLVIILTVVVPFHLAPSQQTSSLTTVVVQQFHLVPSQQTSSLTTVMVKQHHKNREHNRSSTKFAMQPIIRRLPCMTKRQEESLFL